MANRPTAALLFLVAACAAPDDGPRVPQEVTYTASEFAFSGPDTIAPGMTTFRFVNEGQQEHHLILVRIHEGHTVQELFEFMAANPSGIPDYVTFVGAANSVQNGGITGSTIDLAEGHYLMVCFIPDPADGMEHVAKGMSRELIVTGPRNEAPAPVASGEVRMSDYTYAFPVMTAGSHTFHMVNDGPQLHEAQLIRLNDGVSAEQFMAALAPGATDPPPGSMLGGSGALSPGADNWWTISLEPGNYIFLCFVPDVDGTGPHIMKGMVKGFSIAAAT